MAGATGRCSSQHSEMLVTSLDDLLSRMQSMFDDMINRTNAIIEACNLSLRGEISTVREDIQCVQNENRAEIEGLAECVAEIKADVCHVAERAAASEKSNDLLLFGVPFHPSENLPRYMRLICAQLGLADFPHVYLKRLGRFPIKPGVTSPIVIQFAFKHERYDFFRRYIATRCLSLRHLGFKKDDRIYLNENLTELGRKIKRAALRLRACGKLHGVFTTDGIVYTKATADAKAVAILSLERLPT